MAELDSFHLMMVIFEPSSLKEEKIPQNLLIHVKTSTNMYYLEHIIPKITIIYILGSKNIHHQISTQKVGENHIFVPTFSGDSHFGPQIFFFTAFSPYPEKRFPFWSLQLHQRRKCTCNKRQN